MNCGLPPVSACRARGERVGGLDLQAAEQRGSRVSGQGLQLDINRGPALRNLPHALLVVSRDFAAAKAGDGAGLTRSPPLIEQGGAHVHHDLKGGRVVKLDVVRQQHVEFVTRGKGKDPEGGHEAQPLRLRGDGGGLLGETLRGQPRQLQADPGLEGGVRVGVEGLPQHSRQRA